MLHKILELSRTHEGRVDGIFGWRRGHLGGSWTGNQWSGAGQGREGASGNGDRRVEGGDVREDCSVGMDSKQLRLDVEWRHADTMRLLPEAFATTRGLKR